MENKVRKKIHIDKFSIREVTILIVVTAIVSLATGFAITTRIMKENDDNNDYKYSDNLEDFIKNYNYIVSNYYGTYDESKVLDYAIKGVLEGLGDPYTVYLDETDTNNLNARLDGNYKGLGIEVYNNQEGNIEILQVFENSPASRAQLKLGDKIIKLDGEDVRKMSTLDFSKKIRDSLKKEFVLNIIREKEEMEIKIGCENVVLSSVASDIFIENNKKIGYLNISVFANNTYSQVKEHLANLELQQIDSLIIDVRFNTGGHLTSVENILGLFLDSSHVIYQIQDSEGINKFNSTGSETKKYPIIVLTNKASASASEILTAALKEEYNAKSLGENTYGKGSAQELRTLPDGTQYKVTTKKWLSPLGNSIDKIGVSVDYEVKMGENYYKNPNRNNDNQLRAAIELLK